MEIGTVVDIKPNASILDCCQGKRGRITHVGVDGGFLLCTDHFCPVERTEEELEVVPPEVLAEEILSKASEGVRADYEAADITLLHEYAPRDEKARAVLILRGESIEI